MAGARAVPGGGVDVMNAGRACMKSSKEIDAYVRGAEVSTRELSLRRHAGW